MIPENYNMLLNSHLMEIKRNVTRGYFNWRMLTCLRIVNVSDIIIQYPIIVHFKVQVFSCNLKEKINVPWDLTNTLFVTCALKGVIFRKYVSIAKTYFVIAFGCPPELNGKTLLLKMPYTLSQDLERPSWY